jgi:hypothetical protein
MHYAGLMYCGFCGGRMRSEVRPRRPGPSPPPLPSRSVSWYCATANRGNGGPHACPFAFRVTAARLDALVGDRVREALRAYGRAAGWKTDRPRTAALARPALPDELAPLLPLWTPADWPAAPAPMSGTGPAGPGREAWEKLTAQARALWPNPSPCLPANRDALWLRPAWEPEKRVFLEGFGLTVGIRVLYPPPPRARVGRDLQQCGGQCCLRLGGPEGGVGHPAAVVLESWPALRAYRSWMTTQCGRYAQVKTLAIDGRISMSNDKNGPVR